ncbi:MAG: hypothetical protein MJ178_00985 [Treponemataceae bacterium]|nr:hypothetical protein [Treponemataceae bacterium]
MTSSAFALILTFINLILWVVFFVVLKKKFSPKNVLDSIKDEVDKLLITINQETDRDLTLLEAKLSEIHEAMKYADYVLQRIQGEDTLANPEYAEKVEMAQEAPAVTVSISDEARAESRTAYREEAVAWEQNMELFTGYPEPAPEPRQPEENGSRKVNRQQVIDLWQMGQSVSEIARRLDVDMTSVQMIIDMFS